MASVALEVWRKARQKRIDELRAAHAAVGGKSPGRRTATEQINRALAVQIASEFQGFARDLHDESVTVLLTSIQATYGQGGFDDLLRYVLTLDRKLDKGNAQPASIGTDFNKLGFVIWEALGKRYKRSTLWNKSLELLNTARNGIAHNDQAKLQIVKSKGYPMTLQSMNRWQSSLNGLAGAMDAVTAVHLAKTTNGPLPW